jgi:hypothetical protein
MMDALLPLEQIVISNAGVVVFSSSLLDGPSSASLVLLAHTSIVLTSTSGCAAGERRALRSSVGWSEIYCFSDSLSQWPSTPKLQIHSSAKLS